jgi:hypothetical protein
MKLPHEKVPVVARLYGNLGTSTCGVALSIALDNHATKPRNERGPIFVVRGTRHALGWNGLGVIDAAFRIMSQTLGV